MMKIRRIMKKKTGIIAVLLVIMGMSVMLVGGCKKSNDNTNPSPLPETVADVDGNVYHVLVIGTQKWMVENFKTTHYNDGTSIPKVDDKTMWGDTTSLAPKYCWYGNDSVAFNKPYGALYNWYAVNTGKLAPTGWHVATKDDFLVLIAFLGGESVAGGKIKEGGTLHWAPPNTDATNLSGFTALPGGDRFNNGIFYDIIVHTYFWTTTEYNATHAVDYDLGYNHGSLYGGVNDKRDGFSVRCVKN